MNCLSLYALSIVLALPTYGQLHFTKYKKIQSKKVSINNRNISADSTKISFINLSNIPSLKKIKITLAEIKNTDSSNIFIYKSGKLLQQFTIPNGIWHLSDYALVEDINNDKQYDLKFFIHGTGCGLGGEQSTKIYLISQAEKFKLISFFDFAFEDEYDINKDGIYEILGRNYVFHDNHSYWVYNAYNFKNNKLVNISRSVNYPLWTKYLFKSSSKLANKISIEKKMEEYKAVPEGLTVE